jgi:hypothetical protein
VPFGFSGGHSVATGQGPIGRQQRTSPLRARARRQARPGRSARTARSRCCDRGSPTARRREDQRLRQRRARNR